MKNKNKFAFTLVEIMMVMAIIALLAAIGIPSLMNSWREGSSRVKQTNVSTVEAAKGQYALLNNLPDGGNTPSWEQIQPYITGTSTNDTLAKFDVNGVSISINAIGTQAAYPCP